MQKEEKVALRARAREIGPLDQLGVHYRASGRELTAGVLPDLQAHQPARESVPHHQYQHPMTRQANAQGTTCSPAHDSDRLPLRLT
jgi:hypothetical protein